MNQEPNYQNNPLHGLSLKNMLIELVDHYGFEILFAYLNINCFKSNPSIESSVKFLKKTDWAREKVEAFYLYQLKSLPKASAEQFALPPRDRIIPDDQEPGLPAELSLEDAARLNEKRARKAAAHDRGSQRRGTTSSNNWPVRSRTEARPGTRDKNQRGDSRPTKTGPRTNNKNSDPWAKWKDD